MPQQTAVEWLMDRLPHSIETQFSKQIEQAKELEKQKIIEFADKYDAYVVQGGTLTAEQYYNETFNK